MLNDLETYSVLPAQDIARARTFYLDKLGLTPVREDAAQLFYRSPQGSTFLVYETPNAGSAKNTQMGWDTPDLDATMSELRARGVTFEDYDFPGLKTENGVAQFDGERAAWFLDSEGNILNLSQPTAP